MKPGLQLYKETYKLVNMLYQSMPEMDKMHRHIIGVRVLNTSLELLKWVTLANESVNKVMRVKYLKTFICELKQLKNLIRVCNDNKILKISTVTNTQLIINSISKQIIVWKNATSRM